MAIIKCYNSCDAETAVLISSYFLCSPLYVLVYPSVTSRSLCVACACVTRQYMQVVMIVFLSALILTFRRIYVFVWVLLHPL
jgi:hypothetical protein